ncbi:hypothetical protein M5K25_014628 [Dendrobium thyrsiflorum]|uniref:BI1-like protein n=1 Tax=Dendrobium thyrsiflorum TaxID=117978 RepID=A0ABD0UVV8_DENTH
MNISRSSTPQNDLEAAGGGGRLNDPLLSKKSEESEAQRLRWKFIRKVYTILSLQMLLTIAVSAAVVFATPVSLFAYSPAGITLFVFLIFLIVMVMIPLHYYRHYKPCNLILLVVFTVSISFAVGFACAFIDGKVILESAILTTVVLVSLTMYTFLAADRVQDFTFLGPYLFSASMIIIFFIVIQIATMIYGGLASLVFSAYIIYDTSKIIRAYDIEDYVWVIVMLYLDIINLFLSITNLFKGSNKN